MIYWSFSLSLQQIMIKATTDDDLLRIIVVAEHVNYFEDEEHFN